MTRFIARRLGWGIAVLFVVASATFFLLRLAPGGPFDGDKEWLPEIRENIEARYGLDRPLVVQYARHMTGLLRGDLGVSLKYRDTPVARIIGEALPVSLSVGGLGLVIALVLGLPLGIFAAVRAGTRTDAACSMIASLGVAVPNFVVAPVLVCLFAFALRLLPVGGWGTPLHALMPAVALALPYAAYIARLARSGMREVASSDFVRTARAKGVPERRVLLVHIARSGLLPVVSFLGPASAGILTGSVVIERIMAVPGLGSHFVNGALNRDYTVVMGVVLVYGTILVAMNILADVALALLDPRVEMSR